MANRIEEVKKQKPFKIDMTFPTSEMLGKHILGKLETTQAWVVPIYDGKPTQSQLFPQPLDDKELREELLPDEADLGRMFPEVFDGSLSPGEYIEKRDYYIGIAEFWLNHFLALLQPKIEEGGLRFSPGISGIAWHPK